REARKLGFPVFEVPYELPFIALPEKAFIRLVNEQYEVLQRSMAIHKRLERLVLEERGLDELVRALAAAILGVVVVLSARAEAVGGRLELDGLAMRLRPFGIGSEVAVIVFGRGGDVDAAGEAALDRFLADAGVGALVAIRERLLCAVVDAHDDLDPIALAER